MSAPRRFNDDSLEWAIAGARIACAALALVWVVAVFVAIIDASWQAVGMAVAALVLAGLSGWWGWYVMGNQEWRGRGPRPPEH